MSERSVHVIIVSGHLYLDSVERDQYLRESVEIMRQARGWAGCWDFTLTADPLEPDRINVYERWDSDEALLRFRNEATAPAQAAEIRANHVTKYRIASTEAP
jgi:quinol monooxygenase YgiN